MNFLLRPGGTLMGRLRVPGDKSISHRSVMLGALAKGVTEVSGFLEGDDAMATLNAFRAMGVEIEGPVQGKLKIFGVGMRGLRAPEGVLDMGNSGTSIRLLAGLLAGQAFKVSLSGDASLTRRPMARVADPLRLMGATVDTGEGGCPPLTVGGDQLQGIDYHLPMASAQVKSCVLLAGMYAQGTCRVTEPAPTRDHTERMLQGFGYPVKREGSVAIIEGGGELRACTIEVPADISSAAFFMVGASICPDADVTLEHVGINPTRTGVIAILKAMGANIELLNMRTVGGEPVADIRVRGAELQGIDIPEAQVPLAIDEFPVLFIAAACARGRTVLCGAEELRVKESDRIQVMADGLSALGIDAKPTADGLVIEGGQITGGEVDCHDDHRIAMAFSIAALRASGDILVKDCDNVATSFPNFAELAGGAGLNLDVQP